MCFILCPHHVHSLPILNKQGTHITQINRRIFEIKLGDPVFFICGKYLLRLLTPIEVLRKTKQETGDHLRTTQNKRSSKIKDAAESTLPLTQPKLPGQAEDKSERDLAWFGFIHGFTRSRRNAIRGWWADGMKCSAWFWRPPLLGHWPSRNFQKVKTEFFLKFDVKMS